MLSTQISQNNKKEEEASHVHVKRISEYAAPEVDEECHMETSTDEND